MMHLPPTDEFYHPNTLWYKLYDEECHHKSLVDVNFQKYIAIIATHSMYQDWKNNVYEKMDNWSNKAIVIFKILQLLNQFFDSNLIDKRLLYVEDKKLRKLLISFQFWILCERYYALLFYSLDSIQFGDDRNMGTLIRIFKFFCEFFSKYKKIMFQEVQVKQFLDTFHRQLKSYQKSQTNRDATILCNNMLSVINKYTKSHEIEEVEYKTEAYFTILKEIIERSGDMIEEIQNRLMRNYQKRQSVLKANERKRWNNLYFVDTLSEEIKKTYDPKEMLELQKLKLQKQKKRPQRWRQMGIAPKVPKEGQMKSQVTKEKQSIGGKRFSVKKPLEKSDNYSGSKNNIIYNTFINQLVIEENKDEQKVQNDSEGESKDDIDTVKFYMDPYQIMLTTLQPTKARVTQKDIASDYEEEEEAKINKQNKAMGKIVDEVWNHYQDGDEFWYTGGVYGQVETEINRKYLRILQIDSDHEQDEEKKNSLRGYIKKQMKREMLRQQKYNDTEEQLNINKLIFLKKKSAWYFIKNLFVQSKIKSQIQSIVKPKQNICYIYPWDPKFAENKLAIL